MNREYTFEAWLVHQTQPRMFIQWMLDFSEGEFDKRSISFMCVCVSVCAVVHSIYSCFGVDTLSLGCCGRALLLSGNFFYFVALLYVYIYNMDFLRQVVVLVVCYFSGFVQLKFLSVRPRRRMNFKLALSACTYTHKLQLLFSHCFGCMEHAMRLTVDTFFELKKAFSAHK